MDNLSLLKVLADGSRYAIYQLLADADEPLSTTEISTKLNLHPNTVRPHLEKMREAGLLEAEPDRHGTVGRPQYLWTAVAEAPAFGVEPGGFRLLSHLLAEVAAAPKGAAGSAFDVGRREGARRAQAHTAAGAAPGARRTPAAACLRAFVDELADLGFDPVTDPGFDTPGDPTGDGGEQRVAVSFSRCPFRELAVLYPDLVCELHRGLSEGIAAGADVRVESFASLVDEDPCRAEVSLGAR